MTTPAAGRAPGAGRDVAAARRRPDVALVISARDTSSTNVGAVRSILEQAGVDVRLVLLPGRRRTAGVGRALTEALSTGAAFVVYLEPGARLLPGALRRLVDACAGAAATGSVFPLFFEADAAGQVSRQGHRRTRLGLLPFTRAEFDARRELAEGRPLPGVCRIYRREALEEVGLPGGTSAGDLSSYALDLRLAQRFRIVCLPEFLCIGREEAPGRTRGLVGRLGRLSDLRRARRDEHVSWLREPRNRALSIGGEAARAVAEALPGVEGWRAARARRRRPPRPFVERWRPLLDSLHRLSVERLGWWRLDWRRRPRAAADPRRIAYYLWHFPVLSQTFVRREVAALRAAGVEVLVAADGAEDEELLGEEAPALVAGTRYTSAVGDAAVAAFRARLARRRPLALANAFLFVVSRRHGPRKSLAADLTVVRDALRLAALLENERPDRLHAPWADRCSFVALVASRLLRVPFSVQARAHELHDPDYRHPLPDVFRHADMIVTNTAYNVPFIEAHLGRRVGAAPPIHVVHNGLDLERFVPRAGRDGRSTPGIGLGSTAAASGPAVGRVADPAAGALPDPARILCVARLIEQKGLLHLLRACALLRDRGVEVRCDVIGGPEQPLYTNYLVALRREHRRLALGERVRFLGAQPLDVILDAYGRADLFVLPCVVAADGRRDVTPNAVLEAMAMALPVVSTPVGGVPELLEDGVSGVLVPPGDAEALADAVAELIADPERRRRLGRAARARIEERFDARRTAERFRALFTR